MGRIGNDFSSDPSFSKSPGSSSLHLSSGQAWAAPGDLRKGLIRTMTECCPGSTSLQRFQERRMNRMRAHKFRPSRFIATLWRTNQQETNEGPTDRDASLEPFAQTILPLFCYSRTAIPGEPCPPLLIQPTYFRKWPDAAAPEWTRRSQIHARMIGVGQLGLCAVDDGTGSPCKASLFPRLNQLRLPKNSKAILARPARTDPKMGNIITGKM